MQVICPRCQGALECTPDLSGQQVACPHCSQVIQLPLFAPPPSAFSAPPVPPPPPFQTPQTQAPFVPSLNTNTPIRRRSSGAFATVTTAIIGIALVMMGAVVAMFVVCCGMIQSAGEGNVSDAGGEGAGNGAQVNAADRPHNVEMGLIAHLFIRECLKGSTVTFRGDPTIVWNGNRARVVGFMETHANTLQSANHRWYVDFDKFGDEWKPTKVAIDGKEVWRRPKGS
jgi:hypothetical protein